ncbi:MAG TPA: Coenzyme F420 hydrogenase/dehydrogenase, beta subunit C-terminal domain [Bacteroidales bacterium]|nr:Coenzyme F420 hydrogenase/dehydrogenase, beta subunit C-terminal domain [Bacteroidales bacterium]
MKFSTIIREDLCAGCGLCEAFGNKMIIDHNGYLRPGDITFKNKNDESIIESVCPGYLTYVKKTNENISYHRDSVWGDYIKIYKAYSSDSEIRYKGSSGGVITSLLKYALESKYADAAIVTLSDKENPILNRSICTDEINEIVNAISSRYSPSSPLSQLDTYLQQKKRIILVGKPCDITAYKNLESLKPKLKEKVVLTISFLCAGVPSIKGTQQIIRDFNLDIDNVSSIKYRGDGCPGYFTLKTKDNKINRLSYNDSWGKVLNKYLQKRCKICPDGTGEAADIACGDIWEERNGKPVFDNLEGYSLAILRSKKGVDFFKQAVGKDAVRIDSGVKVKYLKKIQPYQVDRRTFLFARYLGMVLSFRKIPKYDKKRFFKFFFISPKRFTGVFFKTFLKSVKSEL